MNYILYPEIKQTNIIKIIRTEIEDYYSVNIYSQNKCKLRNKGRAIFSYLIRLYCGYSYQKIGEELNVTWKAVFKSVQRIKKEDNDLQNIFQKINDKRGRVIACG